MVIEQSSGNNPRLIIVLALRGDDDLQQISTYLRTVSRGAERKWPDLGVAGEAAVALAHLRFVICAGCA